MSRIENQKRLFVELVHELRPLWHRQANSPQVLGQWLARLRAGSRDRKLYRELAYTAWRTIPRIDDLADDEVVVHVAHRAERTKATAGFIDAYRPSDRPPEDDLTKLLPSWIVDECPELLTTRHSTLMLQRAPLWIRLQTTSPAIVAKEFASLDISFERSKHLPGAWRIGTDAPIQSTAAFREGLFEIQDIGSQSLLHALPLLPSGSWLDACAGAGGKTLQLADLLGTTGRVTAHDIRASALQELSVRAERAGLNNVVIEPQPSGQFDGVLVDAPCSGTGTWRRSPHLKWSTSPASLQAAAEKQQEILRRFAPFVAPGGRLVYATCSVCRTENQAVVNAFLADNPAFEPLPLIEPWSQTTVAAGQLRILPADLDSDGYFVAAFRRRSA